MAHVFLIVNQKNQKQNRQQVLPNCQQRKVHRQYGSEIEISRQGIVDNTRESAREGDAVNNIAGPASITMLTKNPLTMSFTFYPPQVSEKKTRKGTR
jgi:hypothetical protein